MSDSSKKTLTLAAGGVVVLAAFAGADDWPTWGRTPERNNSSPETGLPDDFVAGEFIGATDEIDPETTRNVKWIAKLGSQSYGNPTIANGRVYVGTNNDVPRDPKYVGDRSCVYCFDEATGELLWQLNVPKLGTGKVSDWEYLGICCSPAVDGDRVYIVTNRCEVMCLDVNGMADGNDGFQDEGLYAAWPETEPMEIGAKDADIIWTLNMIDECGVFPHNITSSSIAVVGDRLWVSTSNGVDYGHVETPAPFAPTLILVDKNTGELLGEEASGLSQRIFHCTWNSPTYLKTERTVEVDGKARTEELELCIYGGPDGWVYAFKPEPVQDADGFMVLEEAWRVDANPPEYRLDEEGKPRKYATRLGPSEVLGTPMVHDGLVYAVIGQDPEHGEGVGNMVCIDPWGEGDVTASHVRWQYRDINRSLSSMAMKDGLLYAADFSGFVYCVDAATGELVWRHDTMGHIWSSPLLADGKVYIGNEDGYMSIIPAGREYDKKNVKEIDMTSPIYSSAVAANGVLYVASHTHLFAIAKAGEEGR